MSCSRYSAASRARSWSGRPAVASSLRCRTPTAASAPMTAISLTGQAKDRSAPTERESMTMYAPPYALRRMTWTRGTVASQYAYSSRAPCLMMPWCSW